MQKRLGFFFFVLLSFFMPISGALAQETDDLFQDDAFANIAPIEIKNEFTRGQVTKVIEEGAVEVGSFRQPYQKVEVEIVVGDEKGKTFETEYQLTENEKDNQHLAVGDLVVVAKVTGNQVDYYITEPYRLPSVMVVFLGFLILAILFGRKKGFSAIVGLGFSLLVIVKFIVPWIAAGHDPLLVSIVGSFAILLFALYLAHGFHKRTTVALAGTFITLVFAAVISYITVSFTKLFGLGSEEALSLLQGQYRAINLQGLLLGGIIIGALGVLDDVTTAQSATVQELHRANPRLDARELYKRGLSVGREHIASLVNTLALAYVGASLPLMLVFTKVEMPLWVIINSEFLVEEIIRTMIGSAALILAVPVTTYIAARAFVNDPVDEEHDGHGHTHGHIH